MKENRGGNTAQNIQSQDTERGLEEATHLPHLERLPEGFLLLPKSD